MGSKVSTMAAKKRKRIASSFHSVTSKAHSSSQNSSYPNTPPNCTIDEKSHTVHDHSSHISSVTESMITSGRTFHHVENSAYWFPNDDEEMDRLIGVRLDLEHNNALVLDLGCGPGTWIMDVATEYPSSEFIGVDMCDVFPNNIRPANVSFQVGNILKRLPFSDNTFDFVNMRLFIIALKKEEWPILLKEAYRVMKPGGYMQMVECGMLERGNEFVRQSGTIFREMIETLGQDPYVAFKMKTLMEQQEVEVCHYENIDVFLGKQDRLSKEFLWDVCNIFKSAQAIIQEPLGYHTDNFHQFLEKLYKELQKKPDAIWSFSICVGRK
ncbi:hypothetical protein INT47_007024 [Mucor saturninus]|uniref:Methyltransferase domain-containing protein n=1 Tax=Mucor saturninus TaxID=64648 RepID=A0A8H7R5K2_9FUNG|nr:hypothetical protein INT47_007024 [Mucor saturninus]